MKSKLVNMIAVEEWDDLVVATYGRPYMFQQQDGCKERGVFSLTVPDHADDFPRSVIPEKVNGDVMGVSFAAWLSRDPKAALAEEPERGDAIWMIAMFWKRNLYPDVQMIANDLHAKGLLDAGEYVIDIDW